MSGAENPRPKRLVVGILIALAGLLAFVGSFAVWVNRQVLNEESWADTSTRVLASSKVDEALGGYLTNQLFQSVDVEGEVKTLLPSAIKGLAGPASAGIRALADRAVPQILETSQVREIWRQTNKVAVKELIGILEGGNKVLSTKEGVVSLDLHQLITDLAERLGLKAQLESVREKANTPSGEVARSSAESKLGVKIPISESGRLVILRAKQLKTAQDITKAIKGLAVILPVLAVLLLALSVWLAAGWRRRALRTAGWALFAVGVALLIARTIAGNIVVNELVVNPSNRPAAHEAWSIGTGMLRDIGVAVLIYGLLIVLSAWLAGPTRPAVISRQALAPWLREHSTAAYVTAGVVLLLIVLWGPTPSTRQVLPVLLIAVLLALGVTMLRRQTMAEFPDARPTDALAALRRTSHDARAHWHSAWQGESHPPAPPPAAAASEQPTQPHAAAAGGGDPPVQREPPPPAGDPSDH